MIECILYVGHPRTERADRFRVFLSQHFRKVGLASVERIGALDLGGVDLVIVDGEPHESHPPKELTPDALPLPTVLIGGTGGKVSDAIGLKLGWQYGCLCMDHRAIVDEPSLAHPIFRGPLPVHAPAVDTIAAPENFLDYAGSKKVPEKLPVADIHAGPPPRTDEERAEWQARSQALIAAGDYDGFRALVADEPTPGLVSTSAGFLDSPDCERILGGINMKAHDYVAVGRQGRFLAWGFHGDPSTMTDLGKALFLNAIHYIGDFGGAPVEALRVSESRDVLHTTLGFLGTVPAEQAPQLLARGFGDAVPEALGSTAEAALTWWAANRGFLRRTGTAYTGRYELDPDLVEVGLANDDVALLDVIAPLLESAGADGDRARRLWERYVRRDPSDAARECAWLAEHRETLFFSDWAGYRWISRNDPPVLTIPRSGVQQEGPVTVSSSAVRDGDVLDADVTFSLQPGYYLYAPGAADGIAVAIAPVSEHELIEALPATDDFHLTGRPRVALRLRGDTDEVELDVTIQACNEQSCTPPATVRVRAVAAG